MFFRMFLWFAVIALYIFAIYGIGLIALCAVEWSKGELQKWLTATMEGDEELEAPQRIIKLRRTIFFIGLPLLFSAIVIALIAGWNISVYLFSEAFYSLELFLLWCAIGFGSYILHLMIHQRPLDLWRALFISLAGPLVIAYSLQQMFKEK